MNDLIYYLFVLILTMRKLKNKTFVLWRGTRETFGTSVCFMRRVGFLVCLLVGWLYQRYFRDISTGPLQVRPAVGYQRYGFLGFFGFKLPFLPWNKSGRPKVTYNQRYIRSWLADSMTRTGDLWITSPFHHGELRKGRRRLHALRHFT